MSKSRELEEYRKRAEGIIDRMQTQINNQRESISRLVVAVPLRDVPEGGVVVWFRLDEMPTPIAGTNGAMPYLKIESSEVDSEDRVIVTLRPVD